MPGTQVVMRIGFAERWLHRARTQCAEGDVTGGMLTLALAGAEVRYAMEVSGWQSASRTRPSRRGLLGALVLAAAAAAVVALWVGRPGASPSMAAEFDGPPLFRLAADTGTLIAPAIGSSQATIARPPLTAGRRRPGPAAILSRTPSGVSSAPIRHRAPAAPVPSPPAPSAATETASSTPGAAVPLVVSEADLIDMVLAASRALQGTGP